MKSSRGRKMRSQSEGGSVPGWESSLCHHFHYHYYFAVIYRLIALLYVLQPPVGPPLHANTQQNSSLLFMALPQKSLLPYFVEQGRVWDGCDFSSIYPVPKQPKQTSPTGTTSVKHFERIKCSFSTCQSKIASFTINQPAILKQYYKIKSVPYPFKHFFCCC